MLSKWIGAIISALLLAPMAARADIIDGSFTGTISPSGFDYTGVFGPSNTDLTGDTIAGTFSYNTALLSQSISGGQDTATGSPGALTVTIAINGISHTFTDPTSSSVYIDDGSSSGLSELTLQNTNTSGNLNESFSLDISDGATPFVLGGDNLDQSLNITPGPFTSVTGLFDIQDPGVGASGGFTITALTSADTSSVPEPAGMAVLAMGLIGLAGARARKTRGA